MSRPDGVCVRPLGSRGCGGVARLAGVILLAAWWLMPGAPLPAQVEDRATPSAHYFASFSVFVDGQYKEALKDFADDARGAIKTPQSRWIDSICYETMVGECHYEMGLLDQALEHYTAAIKLYVAYNDWMIRVQFSPTIRPASKVVPCPWGNSSRQVRIGVYPTSSLMSQGRINNNDVVRSGGVVQQATLFPINATEIVRCTTLAIRRRIQLLGPTCSYDPLMQELASALMRRPGPPNHWSEAWINCELGMALVGAGKEAQGINALKQSLVAAGEYDHPMTSPALIELGRLALQHGDYPVAAKYFEEAGYAAFNYPDATVLEEAFRYGTLTHMLANRPGVYPPLAAVAQWAKVKNLRQLRASVLLCAAENCAFLGQVRQAASLLDDARLTIGRRDMGFGRIGARSNYLGALVLFQQGKVAEGDAALRTVMGYMQHGSFWLFHIGLADTLCLSQAVSQRVAMELYQDVLRDPQPADWQSDPMESLAVLATPHSPPYEHWFEIALLRKEHEVALEIADRTRRHRFFSSLPYGGRLLSLRWILEAPTDMLDKQSQLHRQDLLNRYPAYAQLSQQAKALRATLEKMPLVAPDQAAARQQSATLGQLAAVSMQQEAAMREMAVRREPAGLVFPPVRPTAEIQKSIPPGQALLVFFATSRQLYGFLLNNEKYTYWQVAAPALLSRQMQGLLRDWGQYAQNHEIALKDLTDTRWKQAAAQLLDNLLKGSKADFTQKFDELVIVPDGALWYLPFEALQVQIDGQPRPLLSRFRIRYVPTASLANPALPGARLIGNTAVVAGKLYPKDDPAATQHTLEQLAAVLPGTVAIGTPLPAPSAVYATLFNRLVVFDDLTLAGAGPYDWAPVPLERNKPGNSLSDWLWLPWGGPSEVVLPGFHTAAEDAMKSVSRAAPGHEIFLSVCALMATGTRTILLSRWRTGGQTALTLTREFVQELPHTAADDAWQRAVFVVADERLDLAAEPRVKATASVDEPPKANHPFFWAGYLLVDVGAATTRPEEPAAEAPVVKPLPPAQPDKVELRPQPPDEKPQPPAAPDATPKLK